MREIILLSPWLESVDVSTGTTIRHAAFVIDYPHTVYRYSTVDITNQPADHLPTTPNLVALRVICPAAMAAEVLADARYADGVLSVEEA